MTIDFDYYIRIESKDGKWSFYTITDSDLSVYFPPQGFNRGHLATLIGYPIDNEVRKIEPIEGIKYKVVFIRTLEQLEGIFRSNKIRKQIEYEDYKPFNLFLVSLRLDKNHYKYKTVQLIICSDTV